MTDAAMRLSAALADRYTIERELGAGGMATVYLAHDVKHDRKVALKVLRPELSAILGGERFLAEIKTTANLQHPHILSLFDSGEADGLVFYVMPYVEGESLRDRLNREKQLPVEEAVRIAREVADALQYAHEHGIVHRDIKPENILLHGGHAMVADFGIALAASRSDGGTRMTETGMSLGTPHYMAPEQAMGEREITPKADIYALGCVLYEMLTAEPPFVGATAQAIIARVMTEAPRSLTLQRHTIPMHVEAATRKALEKLPADRFATAAEFASALGNPSFGTGMLPSQTGATPAGITGRARRIAALAPWLVAALALGAAAWGWSRPAPRSVEWRRVVLWRWPVPAGAVAFALAIAPDEGTIVFGDSAGGTFRLWAKDRDRIAPTPLAGTEDAFVPTFSPDGQWIAFVAAGKLKKVPRLGGSAVTLSDSAALNRPAVGWLDDGTIVFNNARNAVLAVGEDGGPARQVWSPDSTQPRFVTSLVGVPGGKAVLLGSCTAGCQAADIRSLDLRSGETQVIAEEAFAAWYVRDDRVVFARRDGGVFIAPFDRGTLAFSAAPAPVLDGVRTSLGRADMQISRGGMLVYMAGSAVTNQRSQVVWVTRAGAATPVDTGWSFAPTANFGLDLSPDGRRLALSVLASGSEDIWIKELDRGPITRITFDGVNVRPIWTRDGRTVMYSTNQQKGGNEDLRAHRADGTGSESVLLDLPRAVWEVEPTRDPAVLVVRLGVPPTRDIYLAHLGGDSATVTPLMASDQYEETSPVLSPDGRWLAYVSNESGRNEMYVRPFPSVDAGRWQVSRNGGGEPRWAHSGRELFFRDGAGSLVSVAVLPGASFVTGEQRTLFPASGYASSTANPTWAVAPGDQRFLFVRPMPDPSGAEAASLIEVENWLDDVGRAPRSGGR